jgi:predicted negative regulator of RcsB-dependent stress response
MLGKDNVGEVTMIRKILKWLLIVLIIALGALFAWGYAPDLTVTELTPDYANA